MTEQMSDSVTGLVIICNHHLLKLQLQSLWKHFDTAKHSYSTNSLIYKFKNEHYNGKIMTNCIKERVILTHFSLMLPTNEVQAHHMSTHWSHLEANTLALEASSVLVDRTGSIEASSTRTTSFKKITIKKYLRKYFQTLCKINHYEIQLCLYFFI